MNCKLNTYHMKKTFLATLLCALFFVGNAQDPQTGTLDETFGTDGVARISPSSYFDFISALLVQPDGKILTVGRSRQDGANYTVYTARVNSDGTVDDIYGNGGVALFQADPLLYLNESRDAVLAADGTLMIAGHLYDPSGVNKSFLLNVDENGFLNTYFGDNGYVFSEDGHGIVYESIDVDSQGRILVSGYRDDKLLVARFTPTGEPDTSFGTDGMVVLEFDEYPFSFSWALKCDENDNIIIGGARMDNTTTYCGMVCKLDSNGNLDTSFGTNGIVDLNVGTGHEYVLAVEIQENGDIVVAGHSWLANQPDLIYEAYITRITSDGQVDTNFGTNGYTKFAPYARASHSCYGLTIAQDGQIFGTFYAYVYNTGESAAYVFNLDTNGQPKADFADNGLYRFEFTEPEIQASEAAMQSDGKLLIGGYLYDGNIASEVFVTRFNTDVVTESVSEMSNDTYKVYPNPATSMIFVESDVDADANLSIIDVTGRVVREMIFNNNAIVNIEDLNSGVYFIKIQDDNNQTIQKIVVE